MKPKIKPKGGKQGSWATPGLIAGGALLVTLYSWGVDLNTWWTWVLGLFIWAVVDGMTGYVAKRVPRVKTEQRYVKKSK